MNCKDKLSEHTWLLYAQSHLFEYAAAKETQNFTAIMHYYDSYISYNIAVHKII